MAIQTVYYRLKIEGTGWRYRPLAVGRRPQAAKNGPYFIRVRNGAGRYQWVKHDTEHAAEKAAKAAPIARQAQELGLTVDDVTNEANTNRISIKTAVENYFRKPFGPGWALVGDAGYNKDFITAQGISDAFRDAELCAGALDESFSGARDFDSAMGDYQSTRDQHVLPMFEFTCQLATLEPPPPELQQVLGAVHGNQEAMDGFARVNSGVTSPAEFFSPQNLGAIMAAARTT